jgi:WD40 repeat protein
MKRKQMNARNMIENLQQENDDLRRRNESLKADNAKMVGEVYEPVPVPERNYQPRVELIDELEIDPRKRYRLGKVLRTHQGPVHSVNFDSSGPSRHMATASWDATIQFYDLEQDDSSCLIATLGAPETNDQDADCACEMGGLYDVAFAKTMRGIIAAASADTFVYVWNYERNKLLCKLGAHTDEVNGVAFHSSQNVICSSSDDSKAIIWDFHEGIKLRSLSDHTGQVYGSTFLGDEYAYNVATCCFDRKIRVFDMRNKSVVTTLEAQAADIIGMDFCGARHYLATGSDDGQIRLWDARNWRHCLFDIDTQRNCIFDKRWEQNEVKRIAFNSSGTKLATGNSVNQALVYDLVGPSPQIFGILGGTASHSDCVFDCAFGFDSLGVEFVVDASHDHTCYVWRPVK